MQRRDDGGVLWTRAQVAAEVRDIVAQLARVPVARVLLATRFHDDLDWDEWFVLAVSKPIERRLHEYLSDAVLLQLTTVADLVDYVWARMEVLP
jgi:acyl carrier protein